MLNPSHPTHFFATTGTTRTFTLPNTSSELAILAGTQTQPAVLAYANEQTKDDARVKADYVKFPSPSGHGEGRGLFALGREAECDGGPDATRRTRHQCCTSFESAAHRISSAIRSMPAPSTVAVSMPSI